MLYYFERVYPSQEVRPPKENEKDVLIVVNSSAVCACVFGLVWVRPHGKDITKLPYQEKSAPLLCRITVLKPIMSIKHRFETKDFFKAVYVATMNAYIYRGYAELVSRRKQYKTGETLLSLVSQTQRCRQIEWDVRQWCNLRKDPIKQTTKHRTRFVE